MKYITQLFVIYAIFCLPTFSQASEVGHSVLIKDYVEMTQENEGNNSRFVFRLCNINDECEVLGAEGGYSAQDITALSGRIQQLLGAPVVFVADVIGGFFLVGTGAAFIAEPLVLAGAMLGAAGGAAVPFTGVIDGINPAHHFRKGGFKAYLEKSVRLLLKDEDTLSNPHFLFSTGAADQEEFLKKVDYLSDILLDL